MRHGHVVNCPCRGAHAATTAVMGFFCGNSAYVPGCCRTDDEAEIENVAWMLGELLETAFTYMQKTGLSGS